MSRNQRRSPNRLHRQSSLFFAVLLVAVASVSAASDDALASIYRASSLSEAREALDTAEQDLTERQAIDAYRHVAAVAELYGELETALSLYERSADLGDEQSALSRANLFLELGRVEEAEDAARRLVFGAVEFAVRRRATGVVARAMAVTGRLGEAVALLSTVAAIDDAAHLEPETLLLLHDLAGRAGRKDLSDRALERLVELFPESLEATLLRDEPARLTRAPSLSHLLGLEVDAAQRSEEVGQPTTPGMSSDGETPDTNPADGLENEAADQPDQSISIGVQTGSFQDAGNAEYMARDLSELGFTADVISSPGGELHRVVVKRASEQSEQELLLELKSRGIEGFLLF